MSISSSALFAILIAQSPVAEFRFPTEPIGPEAVALGNTGVAASRDAEAALNPASLAGAPRLSLHRFDGYAGYNGFVLAGGFRPAKPLTLGLAFRHFDYGELIEDDLGPGTQELDANEQAYAFTAAAVLAPWVRVGAGVSYLAADYFGSVTSATVWSLGGIAQYARHGRIGLAFRSIGGSAKNDLGDAEYPVPTRLRVGASQRLRLAARPLTIAFDTELRMRRRTDPSLHAGVEWRALRVLALRAGYENLANPDVAGDRHGKWSAGLSAEVGAIALGLAARFGGGEGGEELFLGIDAFR